MKDLFKILVIDDEMHIRQSFADFLEDMGYEVILAENGRAGLDLLLSARPDLVLLDLRMPEMDGLNLLKQSGTLAPGLPIIVISGASRIDDVVRSLRYGAWDYLEKPVRDFSILRHAVEKALEKRRLVQENQAYQEHLESMVRERTLELENANTHLSKINARLHKIVESTQRLAGCTDMAQFSVKVLEEFATHMGAANGSLYLIEKNGLRLQHSLDPGHSSAFIPFPLPEKSVFDMVLNQGRPLLAHNIKEERNYLPSGWPEYSNGSFLAFPIQDSYGSLIGVIALHNRDNLSFTEQDKEIGAILASYSCETIRAIKAFQASRKTELQLRQAQKMEAIGTLAGGIAHDFNNILSSILGYAELTRMDIDITEKAHNHIDQVMKGARRAGELVSQILTFSRQSESELAPLKLYLIVKEAVKFLRSSIPSTIDIVEKINSKSTVLADGTQIHQVVMNLCTNAYHAMRNTGGTLSVSLRDVELAGEDVEEGHSSGPYLVLKVEDTGCGIEEKSIERIFDPYFTTKQVSHGTGLGLSVVIGIVKKHNGFIKVSSRIGSGTVFNVFFPVINNLTDLRPKTEDNIEEFFGTERILLVDDEQSILESTQKILSYMGYAVAGFTDSLSAFKAFEEHPGEFDLVITDMSMPKMDGRQLSEKILSLRKDIPVILNTGFHETFMEEDAVKMGIRRYLQKPVTRQVLTAAIREELDRKRQ